MTLKDFLAQIEANAPVSFAETMAVISENYVYQPTAFRNGEIENAAGQNEGSCKIFAFAKLHDLTEIHTLALFGDYYHVEVLQNPDATDHQNIRQFIKNGWAGIIFENEALKVI